MQHWPNYASIGDFVQLQRGNTYQSKLLDKPGPYLLGLASIDRDGGFRYDKLRTYGGECSEKISVYPGDLYVSLKDVTQCGHLLGSIARVPHNIPKGRMTQDTVKLHFINNLIDKSYFYWALRTPEYRKYCKSRGTGTTNLSLSREDFLSFIIPKPSPTSTIITQTLEYIEDLTVLYRRTNQTLEAIAQAIFKSWFVDFDPVKAKIAALEQGEAPLRAAMCAISGKTDNELDQLPPEQYDELAATAELFPDAMEESELGEIPVGWSVDALGNLVETTGGATPDTKNQKYWEPASYNWTTPKDLSNLEAPILLSTERKVSDAGLAKIGSGLLPTGTLLMSSRAPIGYLAITQVPVAINQGYIAMLPGGKLPPLYLLMWCRENMDMIKERANGSPFMEISKKAFRPLPVLTPPINIITRHLQLTTPIFEQIISKTKAANKIADLRNILLTKLLSNR